MSGGREATGAGGRSSPPSAGAGELRRVVVQLRHELRTSLTAVIGYSDLLLESASDAPAEVTGALRGLKETGGSVLSEIDRHLGDEVLRELEGRTLPAALQRLSEACLGSAFAMEAGCERLIAAAEGTAMYSVIPELCRIQASAAMLSHLLRGYAAELPPEALWPAPALCVEPRVPVEDAAQYRARVLIVDDNSISRDLLRHWVEGQGHAVEEASGGAPALEMLRKDVYDLVLLDLVMPDMHGLEVLAALRAEGRLGLAPILMISASDDVDAVARCIEQGADDYVTKPFNLVLLKARLRASLELRRLRQRERAYLATLQEVRERTEGRAGAD